MNLSNYLHNQSTLLKNQLNKNRKLVNELIIPKTQNSINISKDKIINPYDTIIPNENLNEIKNENNYFIQLYEKTKKLYPTKVEEVFKDLILQYQNNDYKIPDLSDKTINMLIKDLDQAILDYQKENE